MSWTCCWRSRSTRWWMRMRPRRSTWRLEMVDVVIVMVIEVIMKLTLVIEMMLNKEFDVEVDKEVTKEVFMVIMC